MRAAIYGPSRVGPFALSAAVSAAALAPVATPSAVRAQAAEGRITAMMDGAELTWMLGLGDPETDRTSRRNRGRSRE